MMAGKLLSVLAGSAALVVACSDPLIYPYCTNIPAHGCPGGDGDASMNCVDPSCEAIYSRSADCVWTRVATCPGFGRPDSGARDANADSSAVDADSASIPDAPIGDVGFAIPDGAGGGTGCGDLQSPDCPLALALHCGASCCGCESLYVCSGGGWNLWGSCGDGGSIVPLAR